MYTFRFNPVFGKWVMLGGAVHQPHPITDAHILDVGKDDDLMAASYPRQPFLIEPPAGKPFHVHEDQLFASQPPVGEYELLLYKGATNLFSWNSKQWEAWLNLVQHRLRQLHHNPYLHYVHVTLHTQSLDSAPPYARVGDIIAASHQLVGLSTPMDTELADKIADKESVFTIIEDDNGRLYVPSAPLYEKEVWFIPTHYHPGFEQTSKEERRDLAQVLAVLIRQLKLEHPHEEYILDLHTALAGHHEETTWWLQIYRAESGVPSVLPIRALPEAFVQHIRYLLG